MSVKSYSLTTRARLIDFLELSGLSDAENNVLDRIIDSVTEYIENYCDRRFKETTYTDEKYDSDGGVELILNNYPVSQSDTFALSVRNNLNNQDSWTSIDSEDYFVDYNAGIIKAQRGNKFLVGIQIYKVTYTAGYDFDNSTTFLSDTTAGDVEYIAWRLAATAWNRRKGDVGIKSEQIGDYKVVYASEVFGNDEVKEILDKYASSKFASHLTPTQT